MKVRKFKIIVASSRENALDEFFGRFKEAWRNAERGIQDQSEYDMVLTLSSLGGLSKIFSPERIRLIQAIKEKKPETIYQLAKLLGRTPTNVQRDVHELAGLGVIELKKIRRKGQKREVLHPEYNWDGFDIAV